MSILTLNYIQDLSIRLLEIFLSKINFTFTVKLRSISVSKKLKIKKKINKLKKNLTKEKKIEKINRFFNSKRIKYIKLNKKNKKKNRLFFKLADRVVLLNTKIKLSELRYSNPIKKILKLKRHIIRLRNLSNFKKINADSIKWYLKKKRRINKNFFRNRKFKIITKFTLNKNKNIRLSWLNRVYKLWNISKRSFNSVNQVVKSQSGLKSLRYFYKKGLKRCLKLLRQRRLKKTKFKSFYQKYLLFKNKPLKLKFAKNYTKFKKTRNFFNPKKVVRTVLRKNKRRIVSKQLKANLFMRKKFKRRLRRSKRLRNALIRKKIYAATKDSRRLYRVVLGIRSKGKNRLVKSVKSLNHKTFYSKLLQFEMTVISILLKTSFVKSLNDALFLIKSGFVFINGYLVTNPMYSVKNNFLIQLPVSKLIFKWLKLKNSGIFKIRKKVNRLRWYKRRVKSSRFKKKSRRYPKWLYKYTMGGSKVPISCELDVSTFTMVSLYQPYKLNEFSNNFWRFLNINSHNVYLWKLLN